MKVLFVLVIALAQGFAHPGAQLPVNNVQISNLPNIALGNLPSDVELSNDIVISNLPGDVEISQLPGDVEISNLPGDVQISNLPGDVEISQLPGDVEISQLPGDVEISHLPGDVEISQLPGDVEISHLPGDVEISHLPGDVEISHLPGDIPEHVEISHLPGLIELPGGVEISHLPGLDFPVINESPETPSCVKYVRALLEEVLSALPGAPEPPKQVTPPVVENACARCFQKLQLLIERQNSQNSLTTF